MAAGNDSIPWSIRVEENQKNELDTLLKSGDTVGKEVGNQIITAVKLFKAAQSPIVSGDLKELQVHTRRIGEIFYNITQRLDIEINEHDILHKAEMERKNEALDKAFDRVNELDEELKAARENITKKDEEITGHLKTIADTRDKVETLKDLNKTLQEQRNAYKASLEEHQQYKAECEKLKEELSQEKTAKTDAERKASEAAEKLQAANEKAQKAEQDHKEALRIAKENADREHGQAIRDLELKHKQDMIDLKASHQDEINRLHAYYNGEIGKLTIGQAQQQAKKAGAPKEQNKT